MEKGRTNTLKLVRFIVKKGTNCDIITNSSVSEPRGRLFYQHSSQIQIAE